MEAGYAEEWCFGMLVGFGARMTDNFPIKKTPIDLKVHPDSGELIDVEGSSIFGTILFANHKVLSVLQRELSLQIYADYARSLELRSSNQPSKRRQNNATDPTKPSLELSIILYGRPALFEAVGQFAARCNMYLQHPNHCDRNVLYMNPHCLSSPKEIRIMTHDLDADLAGFANQNTQFPANPIDLFTDTNHQEELAESGTPCALRTALYKHQKQALTFMMDRETGWSFDGRHRDIWREEKDSQGRAIYVNTITGHKQLRSPAEFRGGLLIDAPGLGKSLSIIALIATDMQEPGEPNEKLDTATKTLLIVPKSCKSPNQQCHVQVLSRKKVIQTWKDELQKHLKPSSAITYGVYYGKGRARILENLQDYKLVITTYAVVRKDWKSSKVKSEPKAPNIYTFRWRRISVAHIIREPSRSFAQSVCALMAHRRWCVSGTPIQNRLMDLYSLFKFLQCTPFSDLSVFNKYVTEQWKSQSDPRCVARLKNLVGCLSLRRPKTTIKLHPRIDDTVELHFNDHERQDYQRIKSSTLSRLNDAENRVDGAAFFSALRRVNQLRLLCNHGLANYTTADDASTDTLMAKSLWNAEVAQSQFDHLDAVGLARCSNLDETPDDIKSVVFSSWTKTFDILQPQLVSRSIRCVRLDGSLSTTARANVLRAFGNNSGIKVLLATITCGGVGLDLTAASRAYIMEPQWNPMSESQALDRLHRLGQEKEVKTIRYLMKDSWEEQVLKLQKRKQELADLTLNSGTINKADVTHGRLQYLKELVG
ncbi:MAG: hypothetical protein Q9191_004973 [Dirinaria sp. TL-2023a]